MTEVATGAVTDEGDGATAPETHWHVVQTIGLAAPAQDVWDLVGGFLTIHTWHPDIASTEIPEGQTERHALRRFLTFPGPPVSTTTEELRFLDEAGRHYGYRWHSSAWGEEIKEYHAEIRVIETATDQQCLVQWQGWFLYSSDALSAFYRRGLEALAEHFPAGG